jgi:ubiquitin carboxyl-terminal hydrolase 22/27/51
MDDLSAMTTSVNAAQSILDELDHVLFWAGMKPKAPKSRSCVVKSGRCLHVSPFVVRGEVIPSLQDNPVKTLGRVIDGSLSDRKAKDELYKKVQDGLKLIDKSYLTGVMKLFCYQFILLQRICWPLMIYEIPVSWVENLEGQINVFLRKWLGVHRSLSSVALFCQKTPSPLPISSVSTEFKKRKVGAYLQLKESSDITVSENVPLLNTGRKWKVVDAIKDAESDVLISEIRGNTQTGSRGLCSNRRFQNQSRRKKITSAIGDIDDQNRFSKAVQQALQGRWTRWERIVQRDMSFHRLLKSSPQLLSFTIGVTYDTVASPANLKRWGLSDDESCPLCNKSKCTLRHVLSSCPISLASGRYRFRHDLVLKAICHSISLFMKIPKKSAPKGPISFVKPGSSKSKTYVNQDFGILAQANDWQLLADLDRQLVFPKHIVDTKERPDIVIFSNSIRAVLKIELTCPGEENIEFSNAYKTDKYLPLGRECKRAGWKSYLFAVEVGARGYAGASLRSCLAQLGFSGRRLREALNDASVAASKGSFWIWLKRDEPPSESSGCKSGPTPKKARFIPRKPSKIPKDPKPCTPSKIVRAALIRNRIQLPRGLVNLGNTCFINASLQALKQVWPSLLVDSGSPIYDVINTTVADLKSKSSTALYPIALLHEIRRSIKSFSPNSFEDAHEFIVKVLELVNSDRLNLLFVKYSRCLECQHFSLSDDEVFGLSLEVLPELTDSLNKVLADVVVEQQCGGCSKSARVLNSFSVLDLPDILLIQLSRFEVSANKVLKLKQAVSFPLVNLPFQNSTFNLLSVVNHHGSVNSGHYSAFINENGQWFSCNDHIISVIDSAVVISNDAYLLVYSKSA